MKKILILLVIISSFFIFQTSLERYEELIATKFNKFTPNKQIFSFALSAVDGGVDEELFRQNFEALLDKHKLNAYQIVYTNSGNERIVWAHTDDKEYLSGIPLRKGALTELKEGDYYFSYDGDTKGQLFNPVRSNNYKLYHLSDVSNPHQSIFNEYNLYTYEEDSELVFNNFVADFQALYPDLSVFSSSGEMHGEVEIINYDMVLFSILTGLMVVIGLNIMIIKQTKKVQVLKQEGFSSGNVYTYFVLPYIGVVILVQVVVMAILYFYYIETSFTNAKPMLIYLLMASLFFIASLFIFSFISFYTIALISVNLAIKGKVTLNKQKQLNYMLKVILIVITTSFVLTGINYIQGIYRITKEDRFLRSTNRLYTSTYVRPEYIGGLLDDYEEKTAVKDYFVQNNNLFYMDPLDSEAIGNGILITTVSQSYIE